MQCQHIARNRHLMFIILLQEFLQGKQIILYGIMYPASFLLRTGKTESEEGFGLSESPRPKRLEENLCNHF